MKIKQIITEKPDWTGYDPDESAASRRASQAEFERGAAKTAPLKKQTGITYPAWSQAGQRQRGQRVIGDRADHPELFKKKKTWDQLTAGEKQASHDRRKNTVKQWRQSQDQMDPTIAFPPKRKLGGSLTGNREVTAVDDFSNIPGRQVAAGTGAGGPGGRYAPRQVAAGTGAGGPGGRYATPTPSKLPAAGTGADGPAGRYAPKQVAAGTGADGPAGRYAPKQVAAGTGQSGPHGRYAPRQVAAGTGADGPAGRYAPRQVAAGTGVDGPAGRYATPTPTQASGIEYEDPGMDDVGLETPNWWERMMKNAGVGGSKFGDGSNPKVGNLLAKGTRMPTDNAVYADTGEAPEIEKPAGNLLKWMKARAKKPAGVMTGGVPDSVNK